MCYCDVQRLASKGHDSLLDFVEQYLVLYGTRKGEPQAVAVCASCRRSRIVPLPVRELEWKNEVFSGAKEVE